MRQTNQLQLLQVLQLRQHLHQLLLKISWWQFLIECVQTFNRGVAEHTQLRHVL
jgi:hypothetical protein